MPIPIRTVHCRWCSTEQEYFAARRVIGWHTRDDGYPCQGSQRCPRCGRREPDDGATTHSCPAPSTPASRARWLALIRGVLTGRGSRRTTGGRP
jgi:hypothetical protein